MALFKSARRSKPGPQSEDRAARALILLSGLSGLWGGERLDFDPDQRQGGTAKKPLRRAVSMAFELNPEETHVIVHNEIAGLTDHRQSFEVWGQEAAAGELVRTFFTPKGRLTSPCAVRKIQSDRTKLSWRIILETVSWDEGRPCEIRYEFARVQKQLEITVSRCLISHGQKFEPISQARLSKSY